ncbi:MAG: hypothetical protein SCK70_02415, partial [bacterium]|nr:hypothetical protein [bacterium]
KSVTPEIVNFVKCFVSKNSYHNFNLKCPNFRVALATIDLWQDVGKKTIQLPLDCWWVKLSPAID